MSHEALISELAATVGRLNAAGDSWWAGEDIARIAIRRWMSYARRHPKVKRLSNHEARVLDLAKGLRVHFEPGVPYTHPSDWMALAQSLAQVLRESAK